jgi:hypothetical protein
MPEFTPLKHSVFRAEVLQREIEDRDRAILLDQPNHIPLAVLIVSVAALLVAVFFVATSMVWIHPLAQLVRASSQDGQPDATIVLSTNYPELVGPGSVLRVETFHNPQPLVLHVITTTLAACSNEAHTHTSLPGSRCMVLSFPPSEVLALRQALDDQTVLTVQGIDTSAQRCVRWLLRVRSR